MQKLHVNQERLDIDELTNKPANVEWSDISRLFIPMKGLDVTVDDWSLLVVDTSSHKIIYFDPLIDTLHGVTDLQYWNSVGEKLKRLSQISSID